MSDSSQFYLEPFAEASENLIEGDRVAVFTGRLYETLANHGIVISPSARSDSDTLVYIPSSDSYEMVANESLLPTNETNQKPASFAQVVSIHFDRNKISGMYRRFLRPTSNFSIIESESPKVEISAPIVDWGIGRSEVVIQVPSIESLTYSICLELLRSALSLDFLTFTTTSGRRSGK